jgi:hypothetical protein
MLGQRHLLLRRLKVADDTIYPRLCCEDACNYWGEYDDVSLNIVSVSPVETIFGEIRTIVNLFIEKVSTYV